MGNVFSLSTRDYEYRYGMRPDGKMGWVWTYVGKGSNLVDYL